MDALQRTRSAAAMRGDAALADAAHHAMQRRAVSQTPELQDCGQLFEHIEKIGRAPSQLTVARYTGDMAAWMAPYMGTGQVGRLNRQLVENAASGKPVTVRLHAGQSAQVVDANGNVVGTYK